MFIDSDAVEKTIELLNLQDSINAFLPSTQFGISQRAGYANHLLDFLRKAIRYRVNASYLRDVTVAVRQAQEETGLKHLSGKVNLELDNKVYELWIILSGNDFYIRELIHAGKPVVFATDELFQSSKLS